MNKKIIIFLISAILCYGLSFSQICYVTKNGDDESSGASWQTAFKTITRALMEGGAVYVAEGVYQEGDTLFNYAYLYGGFEGTETDPSQRRIPDHPTIIDGENGYTCVYNYMYIDGFHIINGNESYRAGGMYNEFDGTIANCIVYGNSATGYQSAGGIYNDGGMVTNCIAHNNYHETFCGGIANNGGGVIIHCAVYNNQGGGIVNVGNVYNSIIWNNDPYDFMPFIWSEYYGEISHSCFGEALSMDGCIRANPMFVNTSGDPSTWDFRLKKGSSCIDSGAFNHTWDTDISGAPRPGKDGMVCMGAFESPDEYLTGDSHLPSKRLYVSKMGSNEEGTSWEDAFTSIAAALSDIQGDELCEIWVAKGTYKEHETLKVPGKINLHGGFAGNETHNEERHITQNPTIIHGEASHTCIENNGYVDGLYITNGKGYTGGIYNMGTVSHCALYENSASGSGGGMYNYFGLATNCILYKNFAPSDGAGIHNIYGAIVNCALYSNSPYGIYSHGGKTVNAISWGNAMGDVDIYLSGKIFYSCFKETPELNIYGNINLDPLLQNVEGDMSTWDFQLQEGSPCIDAGDPSEGRYDGCLPPGKGGLRNDMGAYGGPGNCKWGFHIGKNELIDSLIGRRIMTSAHFPYADRNSDGVIDIGDLVDFILSFPTPTPIP
ncbi:hypothetical protein JW926_00975 [Candidatus Sumerlaeota bacterium]|nr:hypothetical protein [Candidatus Sumerlaeota bacterium]